MCKCTHWLFAAKEYLFRTAQCDRRFIALHCNHALGTVINGNIIKYTDTEAEGSIVLTIPLMETANRITFKTDPYSIPISC
jgi:hypothetical protein